MWTAEKGNDAAQARMRPAMAECGHAFSTERAPLCGDIHDFFHRSIHAYGWARRDAWEGRREGGRRHGGPGRVHEGRGVTGTARVGGKRREQPAVGLLSREGLGSRDSNPGCLIQSQVSYR